MKVIHRLFEYLETKMIPHTRYEKDIGLSNGYLKTQLKRDADIGESVLLKIIDNSLDLSLSWLLTGEGPMLKGSSTEDKGVIKESPPGECSYCREKEKLISAQHRTIDILERELERCQHQLDHNDNARHRKDDGQKRKAG